MSINQIYVWSQRIHKLMMWLMILLGLVMSVGGLLLHREISGEWIPDLIDMQFVRQVHRLVAQPFALVMGVMILTGLMMWGVPRIIKKRGEKK